MNYTEGIYEVIGPQHRRNKIIALSIEGDLNPLIEHIDTLVHHAYIAGAESTKGLGLNLSKEERADQYCREKGLRP